MSGSLRDRNQGPVYEKPDTGEIIPKKIMDGNIIEIVKIGGPIVAAILVMGGILCWVVKKFLDSARQRDGEFMTFLKIQQQDHKDLITNHLDHDASLHEQTIKAMGDLEKANISFTKTIQALMEFLRKNNKDSKD